MPKNRLFSKELIQVKVLTFMASVRFPITESTNPWWSPGGNTGFESGLRREP